MEFVLFIQIMLVCFIATAFLFLYGLDKYFEAFYLYIARWIILIVMYSVFTILTVIRPIFDILKVLHIFDMYEFIKKFQK